MNLRSFLTLGVIIPPLPNTISDGQLADAAPVMANFNWIVANVNANAATGGNATQWLSGAVPTFLSSNSYSVPGDLRTLHSPGRRIQAVVTASALAYGTIQQSTFGGGNTTVTLVMSAGTLLDAGLSAVNIGILDPVNASVPYFTNIIAGAFNVIAIAASATQILGVGTSAMGDLLGEWSSGTGQFTVKYGGFYEISASGLVGAGGANMTLLQLVAMAWYKNGASQNSMQNVWWPYASGVQTNQVSMCGRNVTTSSAPLVAGDVVDVRITAPAYTGSGFFFQGNIGLRRLAPY